MDVPLELYKSHLDSIHINFFIVKKREKKWNQKIPFWTKKGPMTFRVTICIKKKDQEYATKEILHLITHE